MVLKFKISDLTSGIVIAVLFVTTAVSIAALIFSGMPGDYYVAGVTVLLVATAISALGGVLFSGFWGTVMGPRSGLAPAYAAMIAAIFASSRVPSQSAGMDVFATIIVAMMLATTATGLILFLIGQFRLGGLVRYIPYPVMGGFFAGIGLIFLQGGVEVALGTPLSFASLETYSAIPSLELYCPALLFGVLTYGVQRRIGHWSVVPVMIAIAIAVFYGLIAHNDLNISAVIAAGWLPDISAANSTWPLVGASDFVDVNWTVILQQSGTIATIAMLSAIILLLEVSGVEIIGDSEIDPNRELKVAGATNVVNGIMGGFTGVHSASETALGIKMGAESRLMGLAFFGGIIFTLGFSINFIGLIPNFVLGGLLVFLGLNFLVEWLWQNRRDVPIIDYLLIIAILLVIASVGLLAGVAFGLAVATALFVISYSRLGVVKAMISGRDHASHVVRGPESLRILSDEAQRILILKLQGFIFFGTADSLLDQLRTAIDASSTPIDLVVIDFKHVSRLDTSAAQTFAKLKRWSERDGISIILTELMHADRERLCTVDFFTYGTPSDTKPWRLEFDQLDEGVAWCEEHILRDKLISTNCRQYSIESHLTEVLGDRDAAKQIAPYFEVEEFEAGTLLFQQGDPGDSLYMLCDGEASVFISSTDEKPDRVIRVFQHGTLLGEMAIYTREARTASVRINCKSRLFKLTIAHFDDLQRKEPMAAGLFHSYVVRLLAGRLSRANSEIQQLS